MQPNRLLALVILSVQTTVVTVPVYAQVSYDDPVLSDDITIPTTTPPTFPDEVSIPTGAVTTTQDSPLETPANEVPTTQLPSGLLGTVFDLLGPKQKPGQARVINETQRKLLKVYEYGRKALDAYQLGQQIYQAIDNFSLKRLLGNSIDSVLAAYDKDSSDKRTQGGQEGGSGADDPLYPDPQDPFEVYTQARNDEARRALLPQLMTELVFSEDAQALIKQQGEQVQQSVINTIEATQALVQLSATSQEQAATGADIAVYVAETGQQAQAKKSSQGVLKSLAEQNSMMAQGTATNGAILSNVVSGQEQQKRSTDALVVGSALAHQQRTTGLHLSASELKLQEQIRAELEQYKDERHRAEDQAALQEQLSFNYLYVPGLYPKANP